MKKKIFLFFIISLLFCTMAYTLISVEAAIWKENSDDYPSLAWEDNIEVLTGGNQKDMSFYSGKELFLVSDSNWKDVLPFVSAAVWTQQEGDDVGCSRGYGTPDDVCVYPMLIWHEEEYSYEEKYRAIVEGEEVINDNYAISGNKLAYLKEEDEDWVIVIKDILDGSETVIRDLGENQNINDLHFYKNKVYWFLNSYTESGEERGIYVYDLDSNMKEMVYHVDPENYAHSLDMSDNYLVWIETSGDWPDEIYTIYLYDLMSKTYEIIDEASSSDEFLNGVSTSGNYVVWRKRIDKFSGDEYFLSVYNIETGLIDEMKQPGSMDYPKIRGDKIVWEDYRENAHGIYLYDLITEEEIQRVTWDTYANLYDFDGESLVYTTGDGLKSSYIYNVETDEEKVITNLYNGIFEDFLVSEGNVLFTYSDYRDGESIYLYDGTGFENIDMNVFDIDSSIYFMQQYSPDKVTIIGQTSQELDNLLIAAPELGAGLVVEQVQRIGVGSYLDYWSSYEDIVYVKEDYELALLASAYASLINAPLVIENNPPAGLRLTGKNIICVGSPNIVGCDEQYSLEQLQEKYFEETQTNKFLITNPDDLGLFSLDRYGTDKGDDIFELYSKNSLSAPFLAAAKKELVLPIKSVDYLKVDSALDLQLNKYLDIPEAYRGQCNPLGDCSDGFFIRSTDYYSAGNEASFNFNIDGNPDLEIFIKYQETEVFLGEDKIIYTRIVNKGFSSAENVEIHIRIENESGNVVHSEIILMDDFEAFERRSFEYVFSPAQEGVFNLFMELKLPQDSNTLNNGVEFSLNVISVDWIESVFNFVDETGEPVIMDLGVTYGYFGEDFGEEPKFYEVNGTTQISILDDYETNLFLGNMDSKMENVVFFVYLNSEVDASMGGVSQSIIEERDIGDVLIHAIYANDVEWNYDSINFIALSENPVFEIVNGNNLGLYSCDDWDFDNRECKSSWEIVDSNIEAHQGGYFIDMYGIDLQVLAIGETKDTPNPYHVKNLEVPDFLRPGEDIPEPERGQFTIFLNAFLVNCDSYGEVVDIYLNDELVSSQEEYCKDLDNLVMIDRANIFSEDFDLDELPIGNLEIRVESEGELIFLNDESRHILDFSSDDSLVFMCDSLNDDCAPVVISKTKESFVSDSETFFNFDDLNPDGQYYLSVDAVGKNIEKLSVYFNDIFIGNTSYVGSSDSSILKIDPLTIQTNNKVKLIPHKVEEIGFDGNMLYYAEANIEEEVVLPYYLTIVSSPEAIPMSRLSTDEEDCTANGWFGPYNLEVETDGRVYGSINNHEFINFPVGRISGISVSDTSSNIARSLFFHELPKNKDALLVIREDWQREISEICQEFGCESSGTNEKILETYARRYFWTDEVKNKFDNEFFYSGHDEVDFNNGEIHEKYDDVFLNLFDDHGSSMEFHMMMDSMYMIENKVNLMPSLVVGLACSTCHYRGYGDLFCMQGIRRGAVAQQGAVDVSYWHQQFDNILNGVFLENKTMGEAYLEGRNEDYAIGHNNCGCKGVKGDPFYALLGDPTWRPKWW